VGQGSVVANAEAVVDYLREERGLKVGVLNVTMFRPFPADLITQALKGRQGVAVLERVDQPLAVDQPLLREIRAAVDKALENGRAGKASLPYPGIASYQPDDAPSFYSGCFGLGSRDLQPGDLIAAVENMLPTGKRRRQFYLGIDFVRESSKLPKLQIWQEEMLQQYPQLPDLALQPSYDADLLPAGSISIRIHSVGGWGAITMGKNLALTASELLGLFIKANPKYGSEKKGQPTTFYATLARQPIRLNCELKHVNVVLSPDPNVFRHSDPLAGLAEGGVFVIQSDKPPEELWASLPAAAQHAMRERKLKVAYLDAFKIASSEASDPELRYRMQGAAFMGAFFRLSPLMEREQLTQEKLFEGIAAQLQKKFGHRGEHVVEDNLRVIRRGFEEVQTLDVTALAERQDEVGRNPAMPAMLDGTNVRPGLANPGRFWEQVCFLYKTGQDGIADPFAAISAIPAATSTIRDMTDVRFEVPEFIPASCTGCAQCWTQCPDAAIPGLVSDVDAVLNTAVGAVGANGRSVDRFRTIVKPLANEARRILKTVPFTTFGDVLTQAYQGVVPKLSLDPERRTQLDGEFAAVHAELADFPLAKTSPFFDGPEAKQKGSGGLLSITINPDACKGCNICVQVCPDEALRTVKQTDDIVARMRRHWKLWERLPDTPDRYINVSNIDEGIGVLSSLLLKKADYRSMVGGDGACMGCGEKTVVHLVLSAVNALMHPRVERYVKELDGLIAQLDEKARTILASQADVQRVAAGEGKVELPLDPAKRETVDRLGKVLAQLKDLKWRYTEGPSGRGRATMGMANSTGCSSVWGSTYPFNPYPFPWVNHLFQDAPSIAIGIFEANMRKMADGFAAVRRAKLELAGEYDAKVHGPALARLTWHNFTDEEMGLCPPIFATGGDGAMLDIGFQNLSRLMASGKPIRVMVLDTQVYSNTGGQACTSGFLGQVSDMAAYGKAQHGKEETRKELALIAIAHRNVFVLQSSQATPAHLLSGVLRGLQANVPALFILHAPCPPEHGLGDDQPPDAAKLALESRALAVLTYDPAAGATIGDRLSLDGNPSPEETWPTYRLTYVDDQGNEQAMELPVTVADWAAAEARFRHHFAPVPADANADSLVPFHDYVASNAEEREGKQPFIYVLAPDKKLSKELVSDEIVRLAEDRLSVWHQLKELAGLEVCENARGIVEQQLEGSLQQQLDALRAEYEQKLAELKAQYPIAIARRMAEALLAAGKANLSIADILAQAKDLPPLAAGGVAVATEAGGAVPATGSAAAPAAAAASPASPAPVTSPAPAASAVAVEEEVGIEAYIESERCTSCDECTNLNKRMFAYNDKKQAYIKDAKAGTFKELVTAAERCPAQIIHPGTPLNPKEKDLAKWVKRAERFQ
jgi:pyruvate-ferredoxin/flavodoxin oxidoreductase